MILPESVRESMTAYQVEILAVGSPPVCEAFPDCERPHIGMMSAPAGAFPDEPVFHPFSGKVGDWVVVAPRSLTAGEDGNYFVRHDDILAVLTV